MSLEKELQNADKSLERARSEYFSANAEYLGTLWRHGVLTPSHITKVLYRCNVNAIKHRQLPSDHTSIKLYYGKVPKELCRALYRLSDVIVEIRGTELEEFAQSELAREVKGLLVRPTTIECLQHLEEFISLEYLHLGNVNNKHLTEVKVPETLTKLKEFYCWGHQLTRLDIPENLTNLEKLGCHLKPFTEIRVRRGVEVDVEDAIIINWYE